MSVSMERGCCADSPLLCKECANNAHWKRIPETVRRDRGLGAQSVDGYRSAEAAARSAGRAASGAVSAVCSRKVAMAMRGAPCCQGNMKNGWRSMGRPRFHCIWRSRSPASKALSRREGVVRDESSKNKRGRSRNGSLI